MPTPTDTARRLLRTTAEFWIKSPAFQGEQKYWGEIGKSLLECLENKNLAVVALIAFTMKNAERMSKCSREQLEIASFAHCWALTLLMELIEIEKEEKKNG